MKVLVIEGERYVPAGTLQKAADADLVIAAGRVLKWRYGPAAEVEVTRA
jgi:hypothetical protein